ncbi:MAG: replicative DNA helicase [Tidjanibacter sp.]|nr:replicative DNA helicase [Tidjanibacter sp.]
MALKANQAMTGKARLSYCHLLTPRSSNGGEPKFSVTILVPKTDTATKARLDKAIEEASKNTSSMNGVPSGFTAIDRITLGWQPSDLIIIAARPSMGKTAFVLSMARNVVLEHNKAVAFFSLEMSAYQLMMRLFVSESGLDSKDIRSGRLSPEDWNKLEQATKPLSDAPLFIDDTPALPINEFRSKARRLKTQYDLQLIIIDYLQLMSAGSSETKGNREQEVAFISRSLKAIAKELNVPIIALSQLNRTVESRGGTKRPQLSDLRESGAIEQDADIVAFIHRPEYYGLTEDESGASTAGLAEIILAKHRNGETTDIKLRFRKEQARFMDLDEATVPAAEDYGTIDSEGFAMTGARDFDLGDSTYSSFDNNDMSPF